MSNEATHPSQDGPAEPIAGVDLNRIRAEGRIVAAHAAVLVAEDTVRPLGHGVAGPVNDALLAARVSIVEALRRVDRGRALVVGEDHS
jgi:hypothetical protein